MLLISHLMVTNQPLLRYRDPYDPLLSTPIRQESIHQLIGQSSALRCYRQLLLLLLSAISNT